MSYDLDFWKQPPGFKISAQTVYERLSDGQSVDGLEDLPIEAMVQRIADAFADWDRLDAMYWESSRGAFQLFTTPQFLRVDCYGMERDDLNKLIGIAGEFGCPLYDPQVGRRFEAG